MKIWSGSVRSLLDGLGSTGQRFLSGFDATVYLADLVRGSALSGRAEELRGRSVLIATRDQLTAALALIELDGVARRVVLCPSDVPRKHLPLVIDSAAVDVIVSDHEAVEPIVDVECYMCTTNIVPADYDRSEPCQTEWVLLTSGTTGPPKLVVHTLASLAGAIQHRESASPVVWSTFYDIRRYGGLQIFLRAILTGASLVLSSTEESTADFLVRAGTHGVTHISGTPSHWRRALMSPFANKITPQSVRLSGEIADQAVLSYLQSVYLHAKVAHAFASTEAGLAFEVNDGLAGFPASMIGKYGDVEMKIDDGALRIRSNRIAERYLGSNAESLIGPDGFVDTRDMLELRGDRYYFIGRQDGVINVGGQKVHPEEVEAIINRHPQVRMSLVRTRKNPIMGALVVADVVLNAAPDPANRDAGELRQDILTLCRQALPSYKVPASINFVPSLELAETGKLVRNHA
jgi:acyl-coenzyme A synthetase/AMP-(fatty) acid ligase